MFVAACLQERVHCVLNGFRDVLLLKEVSPFRAACCQQTLHVLMSLNYSTYTGRQVSSNTVTSDMFSNQFALTAVELDPTAHAQSNPRGRQHVFAQQNKAVISYPEQGV